MKGPKAGSSVFRLNVAGDRWRRAMNSDGWFKFLAVMVIAVATAALFVHLFILLMMVAALAISGIWLVQRILGPRPRVPWTIPPAVSARIRAWLRRR